MTIKHTLRNRFREKSDGQSSNEGESGVGGSHRAKKCRSNYSQSECEQPDLSADSCSQSLSLVTACHALFHLTCNYFSH